MACRQELEEDGAVDGEVASNAKAPESSEDTDGSKRGGSGSDHAPDGRRPKSGVEPQLPPKDITAEAPEDCTPEEAYILSQRQKGRPARVELVRDRRQNERGHNGPEIVGGPAEAHHDEKLPTQVVSDLDGETLHVWKAVTRTIDTIPSRCLESGMMVSLVSRQDEFQTWIRNVQLGSGFWPLPRTPDRSRPWG